MRKHQTYPIEVHFKRMQVSKDNGIVTDWRRLRGQLSAMESWTESWNRTRTLCELMLIFWFGNYGLFMLVVTLWELSIRELSVLFSQVFLRLKLFENKKVNYK